jgi:hypothetical protein
MCRVDECVDFSCDQKLFPNLLDPNNQQRLFVFIMPAWLSPCSNERNYSHGDKRKICVKLPFLPFAGKNRRCEDECMCRYQDRSAMFSGIRRLFQRCIGVQSSGIQARKHSGPQVSSSTRLVSQISILSTFYCPLFATELERKTIVESAPYSQAGSTQKVVSPASFESDNESDGYVSDDEDEAFQDAKPAKRSRRATRNHNAKIS